MVTKMVEFIFLFICLFFECFCLETDTISSSLVIKDPDSIVSQKQVFKLGFFSPGNTTNRYLGVLYAFSEETVVWVANRDRPLNDSSGAVTISKDGNLVLFNGRNKTVWSTNATTTSPINTTLQILDTGNLVLRENATGATIWESFSQPSNVFLPTMHISYNTRTGKKVVTSSWKNETDPRVGNFTSGIEVFNNIPQSLIRKNGRPYLREGPWNGQIFLGVRAMYFDYVAGYTQVKNDSAGTFYVTAPVWKVPMKVVLNSSGNSVESMWDDQKKSWITLWEAPENECEIYGTCGPFGSCNIRNSPICSCLRGFAPTNKDEWERANWTSGCRRKIPLHGGRECAGGNEDGFLRLPFMKVPDFVEPFSSRQIDECRSRCLGNCSCIAYAHDHNIGCMFWSNTLIDVMEFGDAGVDLYIRLSSSELDKHQHKNLYIIIPGGAVIVLISTSVFIAWCWMIKLKGVKAKMKNTCEETKVVPSDSTAIVLNDESKVVNIGELPQFTFKMLANATDQFQENNLLGRGGFGPVYKGILANGKEIAVKRLAADSGQGIQEFMNEVSVISKLQHRNLVKLLGGCVEKEEKILVYEYMPNKSLDVCLFVDPTHPAKKVLDWTKRISIIEGIGRGLLYLHRDSRLRIIHRDLKPSNVLLDDDWNPKISDFGMARIFRGNQDHCDTARVVGTYGYMAPEYAIHGRFSEKSDVFSFGVLLLEIIKGEKAAHYCNHERSPSLIASAWKLWSEDNSLAFVDESIGNPDFQEEIARCIQIGLLCVQEFPNDRPTVQTLLSMLTREIVDLPAPEQPVFSEKWNGLSSGNQIGISVNDLTLTVLHGR